MENPLEKELKFYKDNAEQLLQQYRGRYIVIKNSKVIGDYDSDLEAIEKTSSEHEIGTFLVQRCEEGEQSKEQIYHSRVTFG